MDLTKKNSFENSLRRWATVCLWLLLPFLLSSQTTFLDSLISIAKTAKADSNKVLLLTDIAWELKFDDYELAHTYLDEALILAKKIRFRKGEGVANNFKGVVEDIHGNSQAAIEYFSKTLEIRSEIGDLNGVASAYNNIGNVHQNLGDYVPALNSYLQSLRIREELGDTARAIRVYYNIAILHESMGNYLEALDYIYLFLEGTERTNNKKNIANGWNIVGNIKTELDRFEEALEAYQKALTIHQELGNDWEVSSAYNNIANLKDSMAERLLDDEKLGDTTKILFDEAVKIHKDALAIRERLQDTSGIAEIYNNMGYVLKNVGSFYKEKKELALAEAKWREAEEYLRRSLAIREPAGDKAGIMEVYNGLADVRRRQDRYQEALIFAKKYYDIAKEIDDLKFQQNGLKDLARIYYNLGEYKKAYKKRKDYDELRYERFNESRIKDEERRVALYSDRKIKYENERQQQALKLQESELEQSRLVRNSLIGGAFLLLLLAGVMLNRNKVIRKEKQRSDSLLLNILPEKTAEELKLNGRAKARYHEQVTVLFTDFKSFTSIAENTEPEALVEELDYCFQAFDDIISKYNIEKIKTIGDAYLCAAGVPAPSPAHASDIVKAAIEIQQFMEVFRQKQLADHKNAYYCRIGIHSGPVVSGVVGKRKFAYDIWGDTVNIAARMEQSGEINEINISQTTYELVHEEFPCLPRGKVAAKNKGELDMYFIDRKTVEKKMTMVGSV